MRDVADHSEPSTPAEVKSEPMSGLRTSRAEVSDEAVRTALSNAAVAADQLDGQRQFLELKLAALVLESVGQTDQAEQIAINAQSSALGAPDPARRAVGLAVAARVFVTLGQSEGVLAIAEKAEQTAQTLTDPELRSRALGAVVRAYLDVGRPDLATGATEAMVGRDKVMAEVAIDMWDLDLSPTDPRSTRSKDKRPAVDGTSDSAQATAQQDQGVDPLLAVDSQRLAARTSAARALVAIRTRTGRSIPEEVLKLAHS